MEAGRLLQWSRWEDAGSATGDGEEGRNTKGCRNIGNIWVLGQSLLIWTNLRENSLSSFQEHVVQLLTSTN